MPEEEQKAAPTTTATGISETTLKHHAQELGLMGFIFGSRENAATYIAGILAVALLILFCFIAVGQLPVDVKRSDVLQTVGGFFLATIGYLFGSLSGGARRD